jgi:hypothetical protein
MRLVVLGMIALVVTTDLVPILVAVRWVRRRARTVGVASDWHVGAAVFGGLIAGLLANGLTVQCFLLRPSPVGVVPFGWQAVLIVASGTCASALAAGGAYLHLRMVTRRDPDYEEPAGPFTGR